MFKDCLSFNQPVNFDTCHVTTVASMFNGCVSFNQLVVFDLGKVTAICEMFKDCRSLSIPVHLTVRCEDCETRDVFKGCSLLKEGVVG